MNIVVRASMKVKKDDDAAHYHPFPFTKLS